MKKRTQDTKYGPKMVGQSESERIRELERTVGKLTAGRKTKAVFGLAGALGGAYAGKELTQSYFANPVKDLAEAAAEGGDAIRIAGIKAKWKNTDEETVINNYMGKMPEEISCEYKVNNGDSYMSRLKEAFSIYEDKMGKGSGKIPGMKSKVADKVMEPTDKGVAWTREMWKRFWDKKDKETAKQETEATNTNRYQKNYNALADVRAVGIQRMDELKDEMADQARKAAINEDYHKKPDQEGLKNFENLTRKYNETADILLGVKDLDVMEVKEGLDNQNYKAVVEQADQHGFEPMDYSNAGDGLVAPMLIAGTAAGALAGHKVGRLVGKVAHATYRAGTAAATGTKNLVGKLRKKNSRNLEKSVENE